MGDFDDLLAANREFADTFDLSGFDGVAHAGVAIVTCMEQDGWTVDRLGDTSARALLRCGDTTLPFFVWTEEGFAVFAILPFVRIEREVEQCEALGLPLGYYDE